MQGDVCAVGDGEISGGSLCELSAVYTFICMFSILSIGVFMKSVILPLRLPKKLVEEIDHLVKAGLYQSRSEAIRDAARRLIESKRLLLEPYRYYRFRVEEAIMSSKVPPLHPDKVIEELRRIREELWRRGKKYFEL